MERQMPQRSKLRLSESDVRFIRAALLAGSMMAALAL
jgi:hypothetical protein